MKMKRKITCSPADYTSMSDFLKRKSYWYNVEWNKHDEQFEFTYTTDENYYESVMQDLHELSKTIDGYEYKDSLNTAIAAVKTIADMSESDGMSEQEKWRKGID